MEALRRLTSRTFWLAAAWTLLVLVGIILRTEHLAALATAGGAICTAYVGLEKLADRDERKRVIEANANGKH